MTVESFPGPAQYTVSGTGPYAVNFEYTTGAVRVRVSENGELIELSQGSDYTVAPAEGDSGDVTLSSAAATAHDGASLYLDRATEIEQGWAAAAGAREAALEAQLDRLTAGLQEAKAGVSRSLRLNVGTAAPYTPGDQQVPVWDESEQTFINGPTTTEIGNAQGYAVTAERARDDAEDFKDGAERAKNQAEDARDEAQAAAEARSSFASRADFVAADIPDSVLVASFIDYGMVIYVRKDANGTAITSNSGTVNWAPASKNLLEAYGPERDGREDDGPILQKAVDYDPVVWVYGGEYNFTTPVVAPQMELYGIENPIFYTNVPAGEKVLNIRKGSGGVPRTSRSTLDADVSEGDTTITVADGSLYTEGTYIEILSNEYFTGRDDVSGFRSRPKGEFNRIISISGNDLTLEDGLVFAYATRGSVDLVDGSEGTPVVEVNELDLGEPFKMRGIHWIGPGDTGGDPSGDQGYASPVRVTGAKPGSLVENCSFKNHASSSTFFYYCAGQTMRNCYISGPDLGDADNNPRADIRWAKGLTAGSSMHTIFVGNECRNLRRGVDATAISTSIMPSWVINSHNTYQDCMEIVGGHHARHYTAVGNSGRADSLGVLRSTDNTIVGNRVQCLRDRACLTIGSARTTSYSEKPPAGHNIIKDNYAIGATVSEGVEIQAHSIDSLDASGNVWGRLDGGDGYLFYVKEIRNVKIKDHFVGTPEADGASTSTMARIADTSSVPVSVFDDFYVDATGEGWFDVIVDFPDIDSYENWQVKTGNKITANDLTINATIGGEAVQSDIMDDTSGRVALVGMGGLLGETNSILDWDTFEKSQPTNLRYHIGSATLNSPFDSWMALLTLKRADNRVGFLGVKTLHAPAAQIGYFDGTTTTVEDIWHTGNLKKQSVDVRDYGVLGSDNEDNLVDETAGFQAALDAAVSEGKKLYVPGTNYLVAGLEVSVAHRTWIEGDHANPPVLHATQGLVDSGGRILDINSSNFESNTGIITRDIFPGDERIEVSDTSLFAPGMTVLINSDVLWHYEPRNQWYKGELHRVLRVLDATSEIEIEGNCWDFYDVSVETLTVQRWFADSVALEHLRFDLPPPSSSVSTVALSVQRCNDARVHDIAVTGASSNGIQLGRCFGGEIENVDLSNIGRDGSLGYGMLFLSCRGVRKTKIRGRSLRRLWDWSSFSGSGGCPTRLCSVNDFDFDGGGFQVIGEDFWPTDDAVSCGGGGHGPMEASSITNGRVTNAKIGLQTRGLDTVIRNVDFRDDVLYCVQATYGAGLVVDGCTYSRGDADDKIEEGSVECDSFLKIGGGLNWGEWNWHKTTSVTNCHVQGTKRSFIQLAAPDTAENLIVKNNTVRARPKGNEYHVFDSPEGASIITKSIIGRNDVSRLRGADNINPVSSAITLGSGSTLADYVQLGESTFETILSDDEQIMVWAAAFGSSALIAVESDDPDVYGLVQLKDGSSTLTDYGTRGSKLAAADNLGFSGGDGSVVLAMNSIGRVGVKNKTGNTQRIKITVF